MKVAQDLQSKDKFIDYISCTSLTDILALCSSVGPYKKLLRDKGHSFRKATKGLGDFRNEVMHPSRKATVLKNARPAKLVGWEDRLDALISAAEELKVG
ncbi:hypothetical protein [Ornithinimicrobium sp. INDO-MA30-4]|uniref:hypothetical protein n=1 Tax=Ornithinimicrobium sp. INDO-MA30-4 TaxID=2908651 RepID=UPI001F27E9BF|nr:hypothetical protein [Ornithinimicrobium sp. INDO-MA30-4]UJH71172.1 hypothetical protein L0A91_04875 [Ornithinimicrobium sp. INDO-MA30-4]